MVNLDLRISAESRPNIDVCPFVHSSYLMTVLHVRLTEDGRKREEDEQSRAIDYHCQGVVTCELGLGRRT